MALIPPAMPCAQTRASKLSVSWRLCLGSLLVALLILVAYGRLSHAATFTCSSGDSACVIEAMTTANSQDGGLRLLDSTVRDNRGACGGIDNLGAVEIERSRVSGNQTAFGGGLCNRGDLHLNESTVSGNMADTKGGIWAEGGTTRMILIRRACSNL